MILQTVAVFFMTSTRETRLSKRVSAIQERKTGQTELKASDVPKFLVKSGQGNQSLAVLQTIMFCIGGETNVPSIDSIQKQLGHTDWFKHSDMSIWSMAQYLHAHSVKLRLIVPGESKLKFDPRLEAVTATKSRFSEGSLIRQHILAAYNYCEKHAIPRESKVPSVQDLVSSMSGPIVVVLNKTTNSTKGEGAQQHAVVLLEYDSESQAVYTNDPCAAYSYIELEDLTKWWSGMAIVIEW
jgi:hypothetical protein